ncbi:MAG: hypothetical protein K8R11_06055 [Methanococcoides sp.]|nr:hypothetical protein [Methanococcoides sp.]
MVPWIMLIIFVMIILGGFIAYRSMKVQQDIYNKTGKHPKGYYLNKGLAIGIPLGIPFGIIMDNVSIGIPIVVAIGFAIGSAWEKKHEDELRPLTKEEEELKRKTFLFLLGLGVIGFIVFAAGYLLRN